MRDFADRLHDWFAAHGRHDLPWQHPRTPYRVWISEIMLQQTQVAVVIDYFNRFMAAFPTIDALAAAPLDDVLAHWAGLGYYARGRNLHRAARIIADEHDGRLPTCIEALQALPGIGRSTAGAIVSLGHQRRAPILDGNVKRVMARHAGVAGWPGRSAIARQLWHEAEARLPHADAPAHRFADHTQALMDLGAGLCTRRDPACLLCPVAEDCVARIQARTAEIPAPKPARPRPTRVTRLWMLTDADGQVLLCRRPPSGVWAGLWSLPEAEDANTLPQPGMRIAPESVTELAALTHELTHFRWLLHPIAARVTSTSAIADTDDLAWFAPDALPGLPAPIRTLLRQTLATTEPTE